MAPIRRYPRCEPRDSSEPARTGHESGRRREGQVFGLVAGMFLLLLIDAIFIYSSVGMVMLSDACLGGGDAPICSIAIQNLLALMPFVTTAAGLLVGGLAGGIALWRRRSPIPWVVAAWVLTVAAFLTALHLSAPPHS